MKKILFALIAPLLVNTLSAQSFDWATQFGGVAEEIVLSMDVDPSGNIYSTGYFFGSITFDEITFTSNGYGDGFISKIDENGALLWAKQIGQPPVGDFEEYNSTIAKAISIDNSGNIIVAGYFQEAMDADPGEDDYLLTSDSDYEMFILKLDQNGEFVWATSVGSDLDSYEEITSVDTDASGNIYVAGNFREPIEIFGPAGTNVITSAGQSDFFVMKFSSDGSYNWMKSFGGPDIDLVQSMEVTDNGYMYLTGQFRETAIFKPGFLGSDPITLEVSGFNRGIYALELDALGEFSKVIKVGECTENSIAMGLALDINTEQKMVYITGVYGGIMTLNEDTELEFTLDSDNQNEAFIAKVDFVSDKVEWAKEIDGGSDPVFGYSVDTDSESDVYVTGYYSQTISVGDFTLTKLTTNAQENYLVKLDPSGNFTGAYQFGGVNAVDTQKLKIDDSDNIILAGSFESTVDLNPQPSDDDVNLFTSMGFRDSYILKLNPEDNLSTNDHIVQIKTSIYPNPVKDKVTILGANISGEKFQLYDLSGRQLKSGYVSHDNTIILNHLSTNVYLLKFGDHTFKLIKE